MATIEITRQTRLELDAVSFDVGSVLRDLLGTVEQPATSVRVTNAPLPGQPWPEQGGIYAGIVRGDDGTLAHIIVAPKGSVGCIEGITWGGYGSETAGAQSRWDGFSNTVDLLREPDDKHPAAQAIASLTLGGFKDWYLPSQAELALCLATVRDQFEPESHWSSTQYSAGTAWYASV